MLVRADSGECSAPSPHSPMHPQGAGPLRSTDPAAKNKWPVTSPLLTPCTLSRKFLSWHLLMAAILLGCTPSPTHGHDHRWPNPLRRGDENVAVVIFHRQPSRCSKLIEPGRKQTLSLKIGPNLGAITRFAPHRVCEPRSRREWTVTRPPLAVSFVAALQEGHEPPRCQCRMKVRPRVELPCVRYRCSPGRERARETQIPCSLGLHGLTRIICTAAQDAGRGDAETVGRATKPSGDDIKPLLGHWSPYRPHLY